MLLLLSKVSFYIRLHTHVEQRGLTKTKKNIDQLKKSNASLLFYRRVPLLFDYVSYL